ncbi:MAG: VCBS repeat-containing protein [Verrucomicrobia bacterium]|nr:VCBS repeat-containing protein [Verrucomicrobiota bacterium]
MGIACAARAAVVTNAPGRPPAESTRRMAERLAKLRETVDPRGVPYLTDRRLALMEADLRRATNAAQQATLRLDRARELQLAGKTTESLEALSALESDLAAASLTLTPRLQGELRLQKAMGHLRQGEQENCLLHHHAKSCLLPLEPEGYHRLPRGSRNAIPLFTTHLGQFTNDLGARWLLNIAYMTLGEWPEQVPSAWRIPASVFDSEHPLPRFDNVAGGLGLDVDDLAGGCVLDDFNNDGLLDVLVSAWSFEGQLRLFQNDGRGGFDDITAAAGLLGVLGGLNLQQTDYNNDGWLDFWMLRGAWLGKSGRIPNSLMRNNGDGTFTDVTEEAGLLSFHPTQTSVWFDYDGDGWLDLFIGNETSEPRDADPCELFHNNGNGTFTECAAASGLRIRRFVKGVACADYDRDGRPDLYLSCLDGPNLLYRNQGPRADGGWQFLDVSEAAGVSDRVLSFATWFFDYDNDGWEDILVCGYRIRGVGDVAADYLGLPHTAALPRLYRNQGNGTFQDVTRAARLNRIIHTMGCNFGDLDNDGWLDFYAATGDPDLRTLIPNRMFRNDGGTQFQDVTTAGGFGHLQKGHAVAFADLDQDGDQDVYAVMGGAFTGDNARNVLFRNPGGTNHWLKLKLEGRTANRAAIGARIEVALATPGGPRILHKTVNSGASFGSNPLRQELGLGDATTVTSVTITWPGSGLREVHTGVTPDRAYLFQEGVAQARELPVTPIPFRLGAMAARGAQHAESE